MNVNDPQDESSYDLPEDQDDGDPRNGDDEVPPPVGDADVLGFIIEDEIQAAEAVDAINTAQERLARIKGMTLAWVRGAEREVAHLQAQYSEPLKRWAAGQLLFSKRRSIQLPTGKLQFTKVPRRLAVVEPSGALLWAMEHCTDALDVKLRKADLLKYATENGKVPTGCEWQEEHDSFKVGGAK